jgi:hypothetical protein
MARDAGRLCGHIGVVMHCRLAEMEGNRFVHILKTTDIGTRGEMYFQCTANDSERF